MNRGTSSVKDLSTSAAQEPYTSGVALSSDGVAIAYRQLGHGPGLVILHGAMETAQSHLQLAEALADTFTVYLPDRRGRGQSGASGQAYGMREVVDDVDALMTKTDSHAIFGVSSGALIALQAALTLPAIRKAALFEPPLSVNGSAPTGWATRLDAEIAQGKLDAALVTGMLGAQMGPPIFQRLPRWLLTSLTRMAMASEDKKAVDASTTMRALAPTLRDDGRLIVEMSETLERFRAMPAETLLLGGSNSPKYLKVALDALEKVLPGVKRIEYPGLDHGATGNADRGGKPELVAKDLRQFFA